MTPQESAIENLRNLCQALRWASGDDPYSEVEITAMCDRAERALEQVEQLQKDKDLYERLYHEYEARDQLDQDRSDYLGSISPLARGAMRGIPDLAGEDRSNRVAGQPEGGE